MNIRLSVAAALATATCAVSMYQLFIGTTWFFAGLGAVIVVAMAGIGARRLGGHVVVAPVIGALALLLYFTLTFASADAIALIIPTPAALEHLGSLVSAGWTETSTYAAPVPSLAGLNMVAGLGIAIVALLVDFLAVQLRRAALAGLPLLALYSVPAAVHEATVNFVVFLIGAAGFLYLLLVDSSDHLSGWGRPVFTRRWIAEQASYRPDISQLGRTGRRVGAAALAVAVIVPLAMPHVEPKGIFNGHGDSGSTVETPNPMVSLRQQLTMAENAVVLTYDTNDPDPPYLQMYTLDQFDGQNWSYSPLLTSRSPRIRGRALPSPQGLTNASGIPVTTNVAVADNVKHMDFLPMPYAPTNVSIGGDWHVDPSTLMVFSLDDSAGGRSYTVKSLEVEPRAAQLAASASLPIPPAVRDRYMTVPGAVSARVVALARSITKTDQTPYAKALALQAWFTDSHIFTYSLTAPPVNSTNALTTFLFTTHIGFCEQFSAAMAIMARILGIPARVAVGYTSGTRTGKDTWVVRTSDTHAWPELYFSGLGWLRFEPTPAGFGGQGTATVPTYTLPPGKGTPGQNGNLNSVGAPPDLPRHGLPSTTQQHKPNVAPGGATSSTPTKNPGGFPVGWLILVVAIALLGACPAAIGAWARRRRWARAADDAARASAAWAELRATAIDHGFDWHASDTPRLAANRLAGALGLGVAEVKAPLERIRSAAERARYARTPVPSKDLRSDLGAVRAALIKGSRRRTRFLARLWPGSDLRDALVYVRPYWPSWRRRQRSSIRSMKDDFGG